MFPRYLADVTNVAMKFVKEMERPAQVVVHCSWTEHQGFLQRSGFRRTFCIPFLPGSAVRPYSGMPPHPAVRTVFKMLFVSPYHVEQDSSWEELYSGWRPFLKEEHFAQRCSVQGVCSEVV